MDAFGSISQFPVRHYLAATAIQSKGLDQLVNDPGAALRRLGELSVNEQARAAERAEKTPAISTATDRTISARLMRQALDELRGEARGAAGSEAEGGADRASPRSASEGENSAAVSAREGRERVDGRTNGAENNADNKNAPGQLSPEATPEATIAKMRVVIAAALAPAEPSPQDRAVAQMAQSQLVQASADARAEDRAEMQIRAEGEDGGKGAVSEFNPHPEGNASSLANFLAVNDQNSPYNVLGVI